MSGSRRLRTLAAAVGLMLLLGGVAGGPGQPPARAAAPRFYQFDGGGYGHGIGMSQYGAYGMGLRGVGAGRIIGFYYRGAQARPAGLPSSIRVGLLQANHDPDRGGLLRRVVLRGRRVAGLGGSGAITVSGWARNGRVHRHRLVGNVNWTVRPEGGGASVFSPSGRRVFGPTRARAGVLVRYQTGASRPALLSLPQTGRLLRWGHLEVHLVRRGGTPLHRAVAVIPFNRYLRGLAEMPGSFAMETLKAQAIAARSYALATLQARGQHWGANHWDGCNCAVYADVRDQHYAGYAKEVGYYGGRWVAAVRRTGSLVVRYRGRVVQAFYSSSSGGHTATNRVWGSMPLPWLPSRPDPDDRAAGRNPNHRWSVQLTAATVSARLRSLGVGSVTSMRVTRRIAGSGGRVGTVRVAGTRRTVSVSGARIRSLLGFKSTKFSIRTG